MTFIGGATANDPSSSPGRASGIEAIIPVALAFLAQDPEFGYASMKSDLRSWAKQDPLDALFVTVVGGGLAFYLAEREHNAACQNPWDGILYMATALSVGYDNLFPTTATGHALASFVQTIGPALSGMALDEPAAMKAASDAEAASINRAILARLEDIVRLLEQKAVP
jgi:hypothetical protein